ncbi:hypothetical protein B0H19DRAFT_316689 [Mycena capillaripes]|nr:hypothetical protein B0H19DRAFT_316689 [Mycena capillaripes]
MIESRHVSFFTFPCRCLLLHSRISHALPPTLLPSPPTLPRIPFPFVTSSHFPYLHNSIVLSALSVRCGGYRRRCVLHFPLIVSSCPSHTLPSHLHTSSSYRDALTGLPPFYLQSWLFLSVDSDANDIPRASAWTHTTSTPSARPRTFLCCKRPSSSTATIRRGASPPTSCALSTSRSSPSSPRRPPRPPHLPRPPGPLIHRGLHTRLPARRHPPPALQLLPPQVLDEGPPARSALPRHPPRQPRHRRARHHRARVAAPHLRRVPQCRRHHQEPPSGRRRPRCGAARPAAAHPRPGGGPRYGRCARYGAGAPRERALRPAKAAPHHSVRVACVSRTLQRAHSRPRGCEARGAVHTRDRALAREGAAGICLGLGDLGSSPSLILAATFEKNSISVEYYSVVSLLGNGFFWPKRLCALPICTSSFVLR